MMPIVATILVLSTIVWITARMFGTVVAPPAFFSAVWLLPLVLLWTFGEGFFFSWRAAAVVAGVHVLFALGACVPHFAFAPADGVWARPDTRNAVERDVNLLARITLVFGVLGLIGSLLLLATVVARYGSLAGLLANAGQLRAAFLGGDVRVALPVRVLTLLNYPAVVVAGVLFGMDRTKVGIGVLLPLSGVLIAALAGVARAGVLLGLALYIPGYLITRVASGSAPTWRELAKTAVGLAAPVLAFFTLIQVLRLGADVQGQVLAEALTVRYRNYSFGSLAALSTFLETGWDGKLYWGKAGFMAVVELLAHIGVPIETHFNNYYTFVPIAEAGYRTNIFTFIRPIIEDFGVPGLMLLAWLAGAVGSYLFIKVQSYWRPGAIFLLVGLYSYGMFGIVSSVAIYTNWLISILLPIFSIALARAALYRPAEQPKFDHVS